MTIWFFLFRQKSAGRVKILQLRLGAAPNGSVPPNPSFSKRLEHQWNSPSEGGDLRSSPATGTPPEEPWNNGDRFGENEPTLAADALVY
mgnify:CR=1 FL=1